MDTTQKCKTCLKFVVRNKEPKGNWIFRYVSDDGKVWNGSDCPTCFYDKKIKKTRCYKKDPTFTTNVTRKCRRCSKALESKFYFYHPNCRPNSWVTYEDIVTYSLSLNRR